MSPRRPDESPTAFAARAFAELVRAFRQADAQIREERRRVQESRRAAGTDTPTPTESED